MMCDCGNEMRLTTVEPFTVEFVKQVFVCPVCGEHVNWLKKKDELQGDIYSHHDKT